jgi:hypothetical protein
MPSAAETYGQLVRASQARGAARGESGSPSGLSERWSPGAARFREDPFRENETLSALLAFIQPNDVVLDVGGGAGRYLPLALHCQELVNVEPAAGMGAQFEEAVRHAGIGNARWLQSDWFDADIEGDVTFCANVVYYIEKIAPFVQHLDAAARRRVMIVMHSVPPTNVGARLSRYVNDREQALAPSHRELLPVVWDLGILPEVRVLGPSDFIVERARYDSRETAIASALPLNREPGELDRIRERLEAHFDELFVEAPDGFMRKPVGTEAGVSRVLLITWETRRKN